MSNKYAIKRADGHYLKLATLHGATVAAWVPEQADADTWPSATEATCVALAVTDPPKHWTFVAVTGESR